MSTLYYHGSMNPTNFPQKCINTVDDLSPLPSSAAAGAEFSAFSTVTRAVLSASLYLDGRACSDRQNNATRLEYRGKGNAPVDDCRCLRHPDRIFTCQPDLSPRFERRFQRCDVPWIIGLHRLFQVITNSIELFCVATYGMWYG